MKNIFLILLVFGISARGFTQDKSSDKRKAEKIAFVTTKLELTSAEAEKFWPIYNEAEAERKKMRKEHRAARPEKKISEMTDAEVEKLIDEGLEFQQKELDLRKKYHEKFKAILPIKKVAKLIHLEHEFKKNNRKKTAQPNSPSSGKKK